MSGSFLPEKYREYLGLGAEIAVSLIVPIGLGYLADQYFDTSPWLLLGGAFTGIVIFFFTVLRISNRMNTDN